MSGQLSATELDWTLDTYFRHKSLRCTRYTELLNVKLRQSFIVVIDKK